MEGENLKTLIDKKRRSLSEGMSTKEAEDSDERGDLEADHDDILLNLNNLKN